MKIKRFIAPDVRTAMKQLRQELGADAVILSNKRVEGNTEIVAAVDYDEREIIHSAQRSDSIVQGRDSITENTFSPRHPTPQRPPPEQTYPEPVSPQPISPQPSAPQPSAPQQNASRQNHASDQGIEKSLAELHLELSNLRGLLQDELSQLAWRDMAGKTSAWSTLYNRLMVLGLPRELAERLLNTVTIGSDLDACWKQVLGRLGDCLSVTGDQLLDEGGVVALVGSTGVGKSTTIAKLAARFAMRHGRNQVALITTDCFRIGGQEQLETFAKILGVPMVVATTEQEIRAALVALDNRKLVLIDTAGMSQRDIRLSEQFSTLQNVGCGIQSYVVLSATLMPAVVNEVVTAFGRERLAGAIVTKVDEAASLGPVLSALIRHELPVSYIGNGQRVPEDLIPARADVLVNTAAEMAAIGQEQQHEDAVNSQVN